MADVSETANMAEMDELELPSPRTILRMMMEAPLDMGEFDMAEWLLSRSSATPESGQQQPGESFQIPEQRTRVEVAGGLPLSSSTGFESEPRPQPVNSGSPEQPTQRRLSPGDIRTPVSPFPEERETETNSVTLSSASSITEPGYTLLSQQNLDALLEYESTLSQLYSATTDAIHTSGGSSSTGGLRTLESLDNEVVSALETETTTYDPTIRWLLACDLMGSFSRLHPSQISQFTEFPVNRSILQDVLRMLWLVVEIGDRDALRSLDYSLRGSIW